MIHYPELTEAENAIIDKARAAGFAAYWPAFPSAESQARNTLAGAIRYLAEQKKESTDAHPR